MVAEFHSWFILAFLLIYLPPAQQSCEVGHHRHTELTQKEKSSFVSGNTGSVFT